jgi:phage tail sheath gpL-like
MSVSFSNIAPSTRRPGFHVEFDASAAAGGVVRPKALLIGQKRSTGTATAATPYLLTAADGSDAAGLFGVGSILHRMAMKWRANEDGSCYDLYAISLADDGAGTAAGGTITFGGTATESGTIFLYIGDDLVRIPVTSGDAGAAIATAASAAIAAAPNMQVTAAVNGGTPAQLDVTHRHKGTLGSSLRMAVNFRGLAGGQKLPAGTTCAIVQLTGGATDPALTTAITAMGDVAYDVVVNSLSDVTNRGLIATEIASRWQDARQIFGHAFDFVAGSPGTLGALDSNLEEVTTWGLENPMSASYELAAACAAVFGKVVAVDPAAGETGLEVIGVLGPANSDAFTATERETLLHTGISTLTCVDGALRLEYAITTYQTNGAGVPDEAWLDVQDRYNLMFQARYLRSMFSTKYPRHKLANDGTRFGAGQNIMTPKVAKGEIVSAYRYFESRGLVENFDLMKEHLIVERNEDNPNRLDVVYPPDLINRFRVGAFKIAFRRQYPATA